MLSKERETLIVFLTLGLLLIVVGIVCNPRLIETLLVQDGSIEIETAQDIKRLQVEVILMGIILVIFSLIKHSKMFSKDRVTLIVFLTLGLLLIVGGIVCNPRLIETLLVQDGSIKVETALDIKILQVEVILTGIILVIFSLMKHLKSSLFTKIYLKLKTPHFSKKQILILLIIILFIGSFLRLYNLGNESLYGDEAFTNLISGKGNLISIFDRIETFDNNKPPFYYVLLHSWVKIFGNSEFSLRFLSAIFGSLSILFVYKITKIFFNEGVSLLTTFLFSISRANIQLSQGARYHSLFILLALLSIFFFIKIFREQEKNKFLIPMYVLFTSLMLYTHYYGIFIILFENLYFLLNLKKYKKYLIKFIISQFVIFLAFLPWLSILSTQINSFFNITPADLYTVIGSGRDPIAPPPNLFSILDVYSIFTRYWTRSFFYPEVFFYFILCFVGIWIGLKDRSFSLEKLSFFMLWLTVPVLLPYIISRKLLGVFFYWKYFGYVCPAYFIFICNGINCIRKKYFKTSLLISWIIIMHFILPLSSFVKFDQEEQWREVSEHIKQNEQKEDLILINAGYMKPAFTYYYNDSTKIIPLLSSRDSSRNEIFFESIFEEVKLGKRIWLIASHNKRTNKFYRNKLSKLYRNTSEFKYIGIELIFFTNEN